MKPFPRLALLTAAGIPVLGSCGDSGTAPSMTPRLPDTVSTATANRTYLNWFEGSLSRLGVSPTGDTTSSPPIVRVIDYRRRGVPNVTVNFAVVSGGGTLASPQVVSDAAGIARAGAWRLGPIAGVNVVRVTSPSNNDTVYFSVEAVDVDASPPDGRFVLDRVDGAELPTMMRGGPVSGSDLLSADIEIRGSRFVITWSYRWPGEDQSEIQRFEGSIGPRTPYLVLLMDGLTSLGPPMEIPALLLADGRLRLGNYTDDWPLSGRYQDFKRAR